MVDGGELLRAVAELAAVVLLARHWPAKGSRKDGALALAGALLRAGFDVERVEDILRNVAVAANDEEAQKRAAAARLTEFRIREGDTAYGFPKLSELIGKKVASRALDWLKAGEQEAEQEQDGEDLDAAREVLKGLPEVIKRDLGAAFQEPVIGALAVVRRRDAATWARSKAELQRAKISIRDVEAEIRKHAGAGLRVVEPGEQAEGRTSGDLLGEDCPAPQLQIPDGFSLRRDATIAVQTRDEILIDVVIAHAPIVIAGKLRDVDEGTESLDLRYLWPDGWRQLIADRGVALDARQIVTLASRGFPVASTTAKELVGYLHGLEGMNFQRIPASQSTSHLGWQGTDGELGFLVGRQLVQPDGTLAPIPGAEDEAGGLTGFVSEASGDDQIADAIHCRGSMHEWLRAVRVIANYPRALVGLYASFVPPLLRILRAPNFVIDWASRTSTGKTTVLRTSASVWGNPNEHDANSLLGCWDSTSVYVERSSAVLSGLPTFLDESQRAKEPRTVANVLYEVAHGRGRSRGNVKSLSRTRTWQTVLLSTGEVPAVAFTRDGGTRARCIEIRGFPFIKVDAETARLVTELNLQVCANYGHAGLQFIQWLIQERSYWKTVEEDYRYYIGEWSSRVREDLRVDPAIVSRLAHYVATISTVAAWLPQVFNLGWAYEDPLEEIWNELVAGSSEATGDARALRDVMSWAHSHAESFYGRQQPDIYGRLKAPPNGWAGRWDPKESWDSIGFYPHVLDKILEDFGYSPEGILEGWRQRGWLDTSSGRRQKRVRVQEENPYLVVIQRAGVDEVEE